MFFLLFYPVSYNTSDIYCYPIKLWSDDCKLHYPVLKLVKLKFHVNMLKIYATHKYGYLLAEFKSITCRLYCLF